MLKVLNENLGSNENLVSNNGGSLGEFPLLFSTLSGLISPVHSLLMFVDMRINILWEKSVKMTHINENSIKHGF